MYGERERGVGGGMEDPVTICWLFITSFNCCSLALSSLSLSIHPSLSPHLIQTAKHTQHALKTHTEKSRDKSTFLWTPIELNTL